MDLSEFTREQRAERTQEWRSWRVWILKAEAAIGHDLDGDQDTDGYSFEFAREAFERRQTPAQYVARVRANPAYSGNWRERA